ncbi:MAG: serine/threonine-protein kinase [Polyangiales bacterium]
MSSSPSNLPIGQVIGSRYRIQSLIGRGGMGMVYAAVHELTARRVALKLMISHGDDSPVVQERFLSEARIAAAVRHPNIVDVLDMGIYDGVPFLVMELLEGNSLDSVLESQKQLAVDKALAWLLPIMGALAFLHDADIVHRDVKPSNIFLSSLPRHPIRPKLLDFGLARTISDLRLTRSGTVIGTPLYMAPEHASGQPTGPQSDVWSLGVVLYEAIAGTSPFQYTDRGSLAAQVLAGRTRPMAERRPDLPALLCNAVDRALQVDPARRYLDMRTFARAIYLAARECGVAVPIDPDPIGLPQLSNIDSAPELGSNVAVTHDLPVSFGLRTTDLAVTPDVDRTSRISRRTVQAPLHRGLWIAGVLALLVVAVAAWTLRDLRDPAAARAPAEAPARDDHDDAPVRAQVSAPNQPTVESLAAPTPEVTPNAAQAPTPAMVDAAVDAAVVTEIQADPEPPRARPSGARRDPRRTRVRGDGRGRTQGEASEAARPARIDEVESEWK